MLKQKFAIYLIVCSVFYIGITASFNAQANSNASTASAVSLLPLASVVQGASAASVELPAMLSVGCASCLVVKTVQSTVNGTLYLFERMSDGATASVEVSATGVSAVSTGVGTMVTVSVIGTGVLLVAAGEAIAFIPNAIGRALLSNERMTP